MRSASVRQLGALFAVATATLAVALPVASQAGFSPPCSLGFAQPGPNEKFDEKALQAAAASLARAVRSGEVENAVSSATRLRHQYCLRERESGGVAKSGSAGAPQPLEGSVINDLISLSELIDARDNRDWHSQQLWMLRAIALQANLTDEQRRRNRIAGLGLEIALRDPAAPATLAEIVAGARLEQLPGDSLLMKYVSDEKRPARFRSFLEQRLVELVKGGSLKEASLIAGLVGSLNANLHTEKHGRTANLRLAKLLALPAPQFKSSEEGVVCPARSVRAGTMRALLVGVANHELKGTGNDARLMQETLLKRGMSAENAILLVKEVANRDDLVSSASAMLEKTGCGDHVYMHFSTTAAPTREFGLPLIGEIAGWQTLMFLGDRRDTTEEGLQRLAEKDFVRGIDLAQLVSAFRNRGATVIAIIDTGYEPGFGIGHFQRRVAPPATWSARMLPNGALQEPDTTPPEGMITLGPRAGDFAAFYASDLTQPAMEQNFPSGEFGLFTYSFAKVLQASEKSSARDLAEAVGKEFQGVRGKLDATPVFEASARDVAVFPLSARAAPQTLDIEILEPPGLRASMAIKSQTPEFDLVGRVANADSVLQMTIDANKEVAPIKPDQNGHFKARIRLEAGQNTVTILVFRNDHSLQFRKLEFTYEGDLERFAAKGERYALLIGVQNYDPKQFPKLSTPLKDIRSIGDTLRAEFGFKTDIEADGGQTMSLVLADATRNDIHRALTALRKRLTEHDQLLIYFAGHGKYEGANREAYWIPRDGLADDDASWISASELRKRIGLMSARGILVIADSCFSGEFTRAPADLSAFSDNRRQALLKAGAKRSRMFISSGGNEPVLDKGCAGQEHSIFACALLGGLKDIKDPVFSSGELFQMHIYAPVSGKSQQEPRRREISDSNHDGGDFIFARVEALRRGQEVEARSTRP